MSLQSVAIVYDLMEAEILRSKLQDSGINAFVFKEAYQAMMPGQLPWKIHIQVPEHMAPEAKMILGLADESSEPHTNASCPQCQSTNIQHSKFMRFATLIASLGMGAVMPLKLHKCKKCQHRF